MKDRDTTINQEIKGKLVAREVLTCFSYEMEAILRASGDGLDSTKSDYPLPSYEDIENLSEYRCPECGEGFQLVNHFIARAGKGFRYGCPTCSAYFDDEPEQEMQEIFEWWIVTKWLHDKLKEKGHPVLAWGNNHYWGRCCTGQAILLDGVVSDIAEEMKILEGQAYSWAK